MEKITIKELARELNLSISTVSRALSDSHETSEATKARVKALAKKLGYKPDVYASNLRSRKSKTICVIIPEITNSFFNHAIEGIEEVARQQGYHVLIHLSHESSSKEESIVHLLLDGRADGVLLSAAGTTASTDHLNELKKRDIPVVLFDRVLANFKTLKIVTDDYNSGFKAASHLIEQGCRNIACLLVSQNLSIDKRRAEGFEDAARKHSVKYGLLNCTQNDKKNFDQITQLLIASNAPDGIFCTVEKLALTAYGVCKENKIAIPEQLKAVSFSNIKIAPLLNPPLTSITQPAFEIGKTAALALFKALKNNYVYDEDQEIIIPSVFTARESTRKQPAIL